MSIITYYQWFHQYISFLAVTRLDVSDGLLHLYALPVGQGNSLVLQCPNGDIAIFDLGSVSHATRGFWSTDEIKAFLQGHNNRIKNIVITHNDTDHYRYIQFIGARRQVQGGALAPPEFCCSRFILFLQQHS